MNHLRHTAVFLAFAVAALFGRAVAARGAEIFGEKINQDDFKRIKADNWTLVGKNIIASGNVHIPFGNFEVYADQAVLNIDSHDLEAVGNIKLQRWQSGRATVDPGQLEELSHRSGIRIKVVGLSGDLWGNRKVQLKVSRPSDSISAHRLSGNLKTGYFSFDKAQLHFRNFICRAESGERKPDGVIELRGAEMSACGYLEHDNGHYSLGAGRMLLTPFAPESYDPGEIDPNVGTGDYAIWLTNGWAKVYGIPVLWLPAFYKPRDESPGICSVVFGKSSGWGYFVSMRKRLSFSDYPASSIQLMGDYYSLRGFGYGANGVFNLEDSRTDYLAYSIYDNHPYKNGNYRDYRLKIPAARFDFRVSNVSHITPRLDFRGSFEYTSDYFFNRDFFSYRYSVNPQPSTYAALEQNFDLFSASVYLRMRVNDFYSTVEKIPEARLDFQRQQIFNTPFYYQGDLSADYMRMRWIKFDRESKVPNYRALRDYQAFRFDTTHFLYLPLQKNTFSLIPRGGVKLTAYSNSSKRGVSTNDLIRMFNAANPTSGGVSDIVNYDHRGGAKVRVVGELGAEASFKIHNTWRDVRSDFLGLDGLRHVMRPYINYTYVSKPNVDRKHLYYFDDIDRIEKENFFRFGVENRLQTRSGDSGIREYFSMENYWDLHLEKSDEGFNNIGNFCTRISFTPIRNLRFSTELSLDAGNNNEDLGPVMRKGRERHVGLEAKWINRWTVSISYEPVKDYAFNFSYNYSSPYNSRSAYSMGSTLSLIDAGSYFNCYRGGRSETFTLGARMPLTPDRRTFAAFNMGYDVLRGGITNLGFMLTRQFHCVELIATLVFDREDDNPSGWETNFSVQARLIGLEMPVNSEANRMLSRANDIDFARQATKNVR